MSDVPNAIAENDAELDKLMDQLEKGLAVPDPEVPAPPESQELPEANVDTLEDNENPKVDMELKQELEKSQARYKTLQGMMTADAQRSREIIERLEEQVAADKAAQVETPLDINSILTLEEIETFGEGGVKVLEKLAGAIATKEISKATLKVEQKLEAMRKRVEMAEAASTGNTTWDLVERINPGAMAINATDPGWFAFLDTADPISGRLYRELGHAASQVNDIQRLSELIDVYRLSANLAKPGIPVKPNQAPTSVSTNDGNRQPKSEKRVYSQDEIREFYDNRARGIQKGITAKLDAKQLFALEADIDAAIEEGRVKL